MTDQAEKRRVQLSIILPLLVTIVPWFVFIVEFSLETNLNWLGVYPRTLGGLWGILTMPLIHGDIYHLMSNTPPLFIGLALLTYYYKEIAAEVFPLIYITVGIWVWIMARQSYHIGASGVVYGLMSFLFFSGLFRKNRNLMAVTLTVTVLYGGIIWTALPMVKEGISWEGHLMGLISGLFAAYYYRKRGPKNDEVQYDGKEDDEYWEYQNNTNPYLMFYTYEEKRKPKQEQEQKETN